MGDLKKLVCGVKTCLGRRRLAFACLPKPGQWTFLAGAARDGWGDRWKSQNRKNVYLSPYVEEPLNSKVIKSFVPEQRIRKSFSCFDIPMFYVIYKCIFCTCMNMSISRIHIWLWYIYIFGARAGHIVHGMAIGETAKNIDSISSGLFRRLKEREKTRGPQKKRNNKKEAKNKKKKMRCPQKEERKKEETLLSTQGPQWKEKIKKKKNSLTPRRRRKKVGRKEKEKEAKNKKNKMRRHQKEEKKKRRNTTVDTRPQEKEKKKRRKTVQLQEKKGM